MEFDGLIPIKEEPYYGYSEEIPGFSQQLEGDVKVETFDEESECEVVDDDGTFKRFKLVSDFDDCTDVVGQSSWMKEEVWAEECEPSHLKIDGVLSFDVDDALPPYDDSDQDEGNELYVVSKQNVPRGKTDAKKYACTLCEFQCARLSTVKRHVLNHSKKMKFSCKICSFGCNIESRMDLHMVTRHKNYCESCDLEFKKNCQLKQHLKESHNRLYTCATCEKKYIDHSLFEKHIRKCREKKAPPEKKHICKICGYKVESRSLLRLHRQSHPADKPFACRICNYKARTAHLLDVHSRTHSKPYSCLGCKSRFSLPKLLQIHLEKCTNKVAELGCSSCDYRTRFVAKLKIHMMNHSIGDYGCDICDLKFTSVRRLHDHKQSHSTDLEPLACKFCDYRCSMVDTLIAHSSTHKTEASQ